MEKGSFQNEQDRHESGPPVEPPKTASQEIETQNIPLPDEIPEKLDLSSMPLSIARSTAMEALMQQNDDLMARLSVSLRRIASLEDKLTESTSRFEDAKYKYSNLRDQVSILKEKALSISDRKMASEADFNRLKDKLQLLEIQYAELYSSSKGDKLTLKEKNDFLNRQLGRFFRYRKRIKKALFNLERKTHEERKDRENEQNAWARSESDWSQEREQLQARLFSEESSNQEIEKKLAEAADYIKTQSKDFDLNQNKLVDRYEKDLAASNVEIEKLNELRTDLLKKCESRDSLYEENLTLENKVIMANRQRDDLKVKLEGEIGSLQIKLAEYRSEAKSRVLELDSLSRDLAEVESVQKESKEQKEKLEEQVESLQCLWRDNQSQLEKQVEKNKALQKLNQQISTRMNQHRQEIRDLKSLLDSAEMKATEKMKQLKVQVQEYTRLPLSDSEESRDINNVEETKDFHPDLMNKIDSLISEIQSGYSKRPEA